MTYQTDCTLPDSLLEQIAEQGLSILPELVRIVINTAMQAEREQYLGAAAYERTDSRRGHANGYKPKTVTTRVGPVTFDVPQVREGGFYPEALERGLRTERALVTTLAEMYVQGVSTRTVTKYAATAPRLADWMESNIPEGLTVFAWPVRYRRLLRTVNGLERLNREIRRRTRVAVLFPNEASCLRLTTAIVMEVSEEWQTSRVYIRLDEQDR